jgi:hypothetical protein
MIMNAKRLITIVSALTIVLIISGSGYPQAYEASKPCLCKGNPKLKKMIYAGKVKYVVDGFANDWEDWSTSMLKPDGAPPKKLPREQDELGASLDKYDQWSCKYSASKIVDNDPATAWAEGVEGDGIGEIVIVKIKSNQPLAIWAGLGASQSLYKANNRPRRVRVYVLQADPVTAYDLNQSGMTHRNLQVIGKHDVELKDINGFQPLPLPGHSYKKGEGHAFIAIEILSVYRGSKYRDTCISEVRIDIDNKR